MSRDSSTREMQVNGVWIWDDGRESNEEAVINPTSSYIHHEAMVTWRTPVADLPTLCRTSTVSFWKKMHRSDSSLYASAQLEVLHGGTPISRMGRCYPRMCAPLKEAVNGFSNWSQEQTLHKS